MKVKPHDEKKARKGIAQPIIIASMSTPLHQLSIEGAKTLSEKQIVALTNTEALQAFTDSKEHTELLAAIKERALEVLPSKSAHSTYQQIYSRHKYLKDKVVTSGKCRERYRAKALAAGRPYTPRAKKPDEDPTVFVEDTYSDAKYEAHSRHLIAGKPWKTDIAMIGDGKVMSSFSVLCPTSIKPTSKRSQRSHAANFRLNSKP